MSSLVPAPKPPCGFIQNLERALTSCAWCAQMAARLAMAAQAALAASGVPAAAADVEMRIAAQLAALESVGIGACIIVRRRTHVPRSGTGDCHARGSAALRHRHRRRV